MLYLRVKRERTEMGSTVVLVHRKKVFVANQRRENSRWFAFCRVVQLSRTSGPASMVTAVAVPTGTDPSKVHWVRWREERGILSVPGNVYEVIRHTYSWGVSKTSLEMEEQSKDVPFALNTYPSGKKQCRCCRTQVHNEICFMLTQLTYVLSGKCFVYKGHCCLLPFLDSFQSAVALLLRPSQAKPRSYLWAT